MTAHRRGEHAAVAQMNSKRARIKLRQVLQRDGNQCYLCKEPFTLEDSPTVEHIVEIKEGGTHDLENLAASHRKCNNERSNPRRRRPARSHLSPTKR